MTRILGINPTHYSYRPWLSFIDQPTGILRVLEWLRRQNNEVGFLDCLPNEPWDAGEDDWDIASFAGTKRCGNYENEHISKPRYHYGMCCSRIKEEIKKFNPDEVWVTSSLTYYYEGVHELINLCKTEFPDVPVKLGGIYASLCPEHAQTSNADEVIVGEILEASDLPPALDLMNPLPDYAVVKPNRGCPYKCIEESQKVLMADYTWRPLNKVKIGDVVMGTNSEGTQYKRSEVLFKKHQGQEDVVRIKARDNYLLCTKDHKILTGESPRTFKSIEDITQNNYSVIFSPFFKNNNPIMGDFIKDSIGVKHLGKANVMDITTSTGNFIAEGFIVHNCSYCSVSALDGSKVRQRTPVDVLNEIQDRIKVFGIKKFLFWASNLLIDSKNYFEKLLDLIIENNLDIEIKASEGVQSNLLTKNLASKMRLAGFKEITIPLESSVSSTLKERFHKPNTKNEYLEAVKIAKEANFSAINSFIMMGLPKQSLDGIVESIVLAFSLGVEPILMPFTPVPQSEEYNNHKEYLDRLGMENLHPLLWPFASKECGVVDLERISRITHHCNSFDDLKNLIKSNGCKQKVDQLFGEELSRHD